MIISVKEIRNFLINVAIALLVGYLSSVLVKIISGSDMQMLYSALTKPSFAPPGIIFPIVWTILYIFMGTSSYLILRKGSNVPRVVDAMFYYGLQLGLNFTWSILFFGFGLRFTAMICLVLLIAVVVIMIMKFSRINKKAGYLNLVQLIWLVYAGFLNYFIWLINS
ncbi:tryptophan-rich sensory protein [Clostridioides mangenotii]|uniref:TspO/MBR family protein n=1 Tax=Metaclostridioides mangenotii TaxID=1540 RepID=UPI001C107EDA|nr:TspO/MBR family protein [Clostridioides mangenotii]MBU5307703.1 tryptophan-rich sensory protein [Clostridioides mangenotii]MCR1954824.1 tryptophan-rich sensory protein [Clostridioides mangenotii]